ncbi:hypothetical protein RJ640_008724 [Escallonia rubra]|uniref:KIB1-4 beta-propeller domain-containing protein n=1 Tax=Escallonia rubra TaxID=112253 RepID=A0AA88UDN2_9ASTE|nr:hypothetical protein RJ640_008724 [Escallonia rubra]
MLLPCSNTANAIREKESVTTMADWSEIPEDLLRAIADPAGAAKDFLPFSVEENREASLPSLPWLMLFPKRVDFHSIPFYSLHNKLYDVALPAETNNPTRCWGSPRGWIIAHGSDTVIRLINPLTQLEIPFPSLPPDKSHFHKARVFERPNVTHSSEILVVIIFCDRYTDFRGGVGIAGPGDEGWTLLEDQEIDRLEDMICFEDRVYGVRTDGTLVLCEVDGPKPKASNFAPPPRKVGVTFDMFNLIESEGDLLMVLAVEYKRQAKSFEVYKFEMDTKQWTGLKDLGNRALFVSDTNYSMSVTVADGVRWRSNCIYCTGSNRYVRLEHGQCSMGMHEIGQTICKFDMREKRVEPDNLYADKLWSPFWLKPSYS